MLWEFVSATKAPPSSELHSQKCGVVLEQGWSFSVRTEWTLTLRAGGDGPRRLRGGLGKFRFNSAILPKCVWRSMSLDILVIVVTGHGLGHEGGSLILSQANLLRSLAAAAEKGKGIAVMVGEFDGGVGGFGVSHRRSLRQPRRPQA